jgi:hypothetical protein
MKYFYLTIFLSLPLLASHVVIIIPGTWATSASWYKPGGEFFEVLRQAAEGDPVIAFNWSCKLNPYDRNVAAVQLVTVLDSYPEGTEFTIIAHSHGGNVGIVATQKMQRQCIRAFYALGTPVDNEGYYPNMQVIKKFFNLFSWQDLVQPLVGYKRIYAEHERIWNISVRVESKAPLHVEMHHPFIGRWIFHVEKHFKENLDWSVNFKRRGIDCNVELNRDRLIEVDNAVLATIPGTLRDRLSSGEPVSH